MYRLRKKLRRSKFRVYSSTMGRVKTFGELFNIKDRILLQLATAATLGKEHRDLQTIAEIAELFLDIIKNEKLRDGWYKDRGLIYVYVNSKHADLIFFEDAGDIDYLEEIAVKGETVYRYNRESKDWLWKDFGDLLNNAVHFFGSKFDKVLLGKQ